MSDYTIDLRDENLRFRPYLRNLALSTMTFFRGNRARRFKKTLPWKKYNAKRKMVRKTTTRTPARSGRSMIPRPVYVRPRRTFKRNTQNVFGSKGITVYQKNSYLLDHSTTKDGFSTASSYFTNYYAAALDGGVQAPWPVPLGTAGTTPNWFVYGRLSSALSLHINSANMATQFTKIKVNRITHTFDFPDQAAATTNDKWPLIIWVNQGDKYRVNIDGFGDATEWSDVDQLLERPGWKKYFVKRMNKLSISYVPTYSKTLEQNVGGTGFDATKLVPVPWLDLDNAANQLTRLIGPTVCFQLPQTFIPASGVAAEYYENAFSSTASVGNNMSTFLEFSTVTVSAQVSFKDPENEATRGC